MPLCLRSWKAPCVEVSEFPFEPVTAFEVKALGVLEVQEEPAGLGSVVPIVFQLGYDLTLAHEVSIALRNVTAGLGEMSLD